MGLMTSCSVSHSPFGPTFLVLVDSHLRFSHTTQDLLDKLTISAVREADKLTKDLEANTERLAFFDQRELPLLLCRVSFAVIALQRKLTMHVTQRKSRASLMRWTISGT